MAIHKQVRGVTMSRVQIQLLWDMEDDDFRTFVGNTGELVTDLETKTTTEDSYEALVAKYGPPQATVVSYVPTM